MGELLTALGQALKGKGRRVLFPEALDQRVVEAATRFKTGGFGVPVLLSQPAGNPGGLEIFSEHPDARRWTDRCIAHFLESQAHKGMTAAGARDAVENDPLLLGALLVRLGYADAGVAGSVATTADVVRAGIRGIGVAEDGGLLSSLFLMQLTERLLAYADCGVNPDPGPEELAHIAIATAATFQRLTGERPAVAMLSFSSKGSARHPRVDKVRAAFERVQELQPGLLADGELQFDAAFVPAVAAQKAPGSPLAGNANVFIFPDLDAGNIAYKITQYLGGAVALGPLLQGLAKPWMDLSRGCSVSDIVEVGIIAATLAADS